MANCNECIKAKTYFLEAMYRAGILFHSSKLNGQLLLTYTMQVGRNILIWLQIYYVQYNVVGVHLTECYICNTVQKFFDSSIPWLFNDGVSTAEFMKRRMRLGDYEWRLGKDLEGNGHGLLECVILTILLERQEDQEEPQLGWPVVQTRFEQGTSSIFSLPNS